MGSSIIVLPVYPIYIIIISNTLKEKADFLVVSVWCGLWIDLGKMILSKRGK